MKYTPFVSAMILSWVTTNAGAEPSTSTNYAVPTATNDAGGQRATSAIYTHDGSLGGISGISTSANDTAKQGYVAQLTEVTGLTLTAAELNLNETTTAQLSAWQTLDDASLLSVPAASVAWSVASGPLSSISSGGLTTADVVFENTTATAQGVFAGNTGTLNLNVVDSLPDNFGTYAGDNLSDTWQVEYFGMDNPQAAPLLDPDHDGFTNHFEFHAGIIPTDGTSIFHINIHSVPGQPHHQQIIFSPRYAGHTYTVMTSTDLTPNSWIALPGGTIIDSGDERTVLDPNANITRNFYKVEISKP
ncbi:MAG: hypothetical protein IPK32_11780 [Verrucomicrobiaceae bacterium]|nr:hypothetical protein [Verrucomicrobiaceae bacterium]